MFHPSICGEHTCRETKKKFPLLLCSLLCMDSPELFGDQISRSRSRDSSYLPKSPIIYLVFSLLVDGPHLTARQLGMYCTVQYLTSACMQHVCDTDRYAVRSSKPIGNLGPWITPNVQYSTVQCSTVEPSMKCREGLVDSVPLPECSKKKKPK